jgi:hypothetical protein
MILACSETRIELPRQAGISARIRSARSDAAGARITSYSKRCACSIVIGDTVRAARSRCYGSAILCILSARYLNAEKSASRVAHMTAVEIHTRFAIFEAVIVGAAVGWRLWLR